MPQRHRQTDIGVKLITSFFAPEVKYFTKLVTFKVFKLFINNVPTSVQIFIEIIHVSF